MREDYMKIFGIGFALILIFGMIMVMFSSISDNKREKSIVQECQDKYKSCDYYECMGNHSSSSVTASMYYSQKTNCLIRGGN
jgi:uncharacterized membrane protein YukC